jgi:hypothetical protein
MMPTNILELGLTQLAKLVGGVRQSSPNFLIKQLRQMHSKNYLNDANKDPRQINFIGMR